jgi:hypothetical protein
MLSMTALVAGIVLFACVVGFTGYMLFSQQKRGQTDTDEIALNAAKLLNADDRIGQMNNVVERCRELVYVSRVNCNLAQGLATPLYQPLANQLLDEARAGAQLVEQERQNQKRLTVNIVQNYIAQHNRMVKTGSRLSLPFFQTNFPIIAATDIGSIQGVQSNVEDLLVIPELKEFDLSQRYIQPGTNLYRGNINAKLPAPDSDLDFKISSLPAQVGGIVAPVRLTNPEVFAAGARIIDEQKPTFKLSDQLAGALQVTQTMDVSGGSNKSSVKLGSTATTCGGLPAPGDVN